MIEDWLRHTLALYLDAAPWLLLGLTAAGLIKAWVPEGRMSRWLGGRGPWPVLKAESRRFFLKSTVNMQVL